MNLGASILQKLGELCAIIREEFDEDGEPYSTTYSHMLFIDGQGVEWDIDGSGADERWVEQCRKMVMKMDTHRNSAMSLC